MMRDNKPIIYCYPLSFVFGCGYITVDIVHCSTDKGTQEFLSNVMKADYSLFNNDILLLLYFCFALLPPHCPCIIDCLVFQLHIKHVVCIFRSPVSNVSTFSCQSPMNALFQPSPGPLVCPEKHCLVMYICFFIMINVYEWFNS